MRCLDTEHGRIGTISQRICGVTWLELREPDADPDSGVPFDRDPDQVKPALRCGKARAPPARTRTRRHRSG